MMRPEPAPSASAPLGRADVVALASIGVVWLAALALIGLRGEFPLNDDWAYARAVQGWVEHGQLERLRWTWIPAWTHFVWGALFAGPFGFSFLALRISTLVAAALGWAGTHLLARRMGAAVLPAALAAAVVAFNPVQLNLSVTFMTDVPFATLCLGSLALLAEAARSRSLPALVGGGALALAATLSRQPGLALPIAFAVACLAADPRDRRRWAMVVGVGVVVLTGHLISERVLLAQSPNLYTVTDVAEVFAASDSAPFHVARGLLTSTVYLGVFLLPMLLGAGSPAPRMAAGAALLGAPLALFGVWRLRAGLPPGTNVIWDIGLGPLTAWGVDAPPHAPRALWWGLMALGGGAGAAMVAGFAAWMARGGRPLLRRPEWLLLLCFVGVYLGPHVLRAPFFDRYLLAVLPPLAVLLAMAAPRAAPPRALRALAFAALAVLAGFAVAGTHDYMARNRVRAALVNELMEQGVSPHRIDAGIEFAGYYTYRLAMGPRRTHGVFDYEDDWLVSYRSEREGFELVRSKGYRRWLPWGEGELYLLRRLPGTEPDGGLRQRMVRPIRKR